MYHLYSVGFESRYGQNGHFPDNLKLLFVCKKVFSKSLLFLDVGDMVYVCFFLVHSSSSICTTCIQSDLSLDMAKMVTFQKTRNFSLSKKKSLL